MKAKLLVFLTITMLTAAAACAQSNSQSHFTEAGPTPIPAATPDSSSADNTTRDWDDCYVFPQVEISTESSLPGPAASGPAVVYGSNDSPNADVIGVYVGSTPSSRQAVGPSGTQISLGQVARNLRQKNQQPTQSFQQIIQDNQGRLEACSAGGTSCRVI